MNTRLRNALIRFGLKSRTVKELMPSIVDNLDEYTSMSLDDFYNKTISMIDEGIQCGLTEHEAHIVREEIKGMAYRLTIPYTEMEESRNWDEMQMNSLLKKVDFGG